MRRTLKEVRALFPAAKYEPRADCKFCGGSGEITGKPGYPCICAFVAHDICDVAADVLGTVARRELAKLKEGRDA